MMRIHKDLETIRIDEEHYPRYKEILESYESEDGDCKSSKRGYDKAVQFLIDIVGGDFGCEKGK